MAPRLFCLRRCYHSDRSTSPQATCALREAKACLSLTPTLFRAFFPLFSPVVVLSRACGAPSMNYPCIHRLAGRSERRAHPDPPADHLKNGMPRGRWSQCLERMPRRNLSVSSPGYLRSNESFSTGVCCRMRRMRSGLVQTGGGRLRVTPPSALAMRNYCGSYLRNGASTRKTCSPFTDRWCRFLLANLGGLGKMKRPSY